MKQSAFALKVAGATALAASTQAYGQIISITPPSNISNPSGGVTHIDEYYNVLTGVTSGTQDGTDDFHFGSYVSGGGGTSSSYVFGLKPGSTIASGYANYLYANALSKGAPIGSDTLQFNEVSKIPGYQVIYLTTVGSDGTVYTPSNYQQPNTDEYLGFQFLDSADGKIHNGWIELDNVAISNGYLSGVNFIAGAYDAIPDGQPGGDILAGEVAMPEPGTISSLVLGAAALAGGGLLRRRRLGLAGNQA